MESIHEIGKFENYRSNPGCRETIDFFFFFFFINGMLHEYLCVQRRDKANILRREDSRQ